MLITMSHSAQFVLGQLAFATKNASMAMVRTKLNAMLWTVILNIVTFVVAFGINM